MGEAGLGDLEGRGDVEDRAAVLLGGDPPGAVGAAVAHPVDPQVGGGGRLADAEEVGVQRVDGAVRADRGTRREQCLGDDGAPERPLGTAPTRPGAEGVLARR
nr:hypothetical protein [Blastococcus sp. TML/C7B]